MRRILVVIGALLAMPMALVLGGLLIVNNFSISNTAGSLLLIGQALTAGMRPESHTAENARVRLGRFFDISPELTENEVGIRSGVLKKLPLGTSESAVNATLARIGIGADKYNVYIPPGNDNVAHIRIAADPREPFSLVHADYLIQLHFDKELRLREIVPKIRLTGL